MSRTLLIAEAGVNHDGSLADALSLVDAAADARADVVKFQSFDAATIATATAQQAAYQRERAAADSQRAMLEKLQLDREAHDRIAARCEERGIEFLSTAFDERSLDWLIELGIRRIKVPSGELTNGPLLLRFARAGLPLVISTGMANLAEVETALSVVAFGRLVAAGDPTADDLRHAYTAAAADGSLAASVTLLHCTSSYPAPPQDVHLRAMDTLRDAFGVPVGYSDHTLGTTVAVAAVARGATVVEKHLTLDRTRPGPDHAASLEPAELSELADAVRTVEAALGGAIKYPTPGEVETIAAARRSLVAAREIRAGHHLTTDDLRAARPGTGRSPMDAWALLGHPVTRDYGPDELIDPEA